METRRDPHQSHRYGFVHDELEGETCVDCGEQATVVYQDTLGLIHFCDECNPGESNMVPRESR